jgi:hypothetical protein
MTPADNANSLGINRLIIIQHILSDGLIGSKGFFQMGLHLTNEKEEYWHLLFLIIFAQLKIIN